MSDSMQTVPARTVTVTGRGEVRVAPDTAVLRVGAVRRGAGVAEAWEVLTATAAELVEVAGRHTDRHRIGSSGISVWPWHDREGQRAGFEARHSYVVAADDLTTAGHLLTDLAAAIGDHLVVDSVGLEIGDAAAARVQARERAFADAAAKAADLARLAGDAVGRVVSVVEGVADVGTAPGVMRAVAASESGIEPGETVVAAHLTVTWELAGGQ